VGGSCAPVLVWGSVVWSFGAGLVAAMVGSCGGHGCVLGVVMGAGSSPAFLRSATHSRFWLESEAFPQGEECLGIRNSHVSWCRFVAPCVSRLQRDEVVGEADVCACGKAATAAAAPLKWCRVVSQADHHSAYGGREHASCESVLWVSGW
jgi:hypothetical protein